MITDEQLDRWERAEYEYPVPTVIGQLIAEVRRLKAGKFTPDEPQNLCHGLSKRDEKAFGEGCRAEQAKPFGRPYQPTCATCGQPGHACAC